MSDPLDKLDFALRKIYIKYLESKQTDAQALAKGVERSGASPEYNLTLRYEGSLSEIEASGFRTTWNEFAGFAHGIVHLDDLERIVSHPNVISLEYGSARWPSLDHSAPDILARSDTAANIGTNGLWFVDRTTGALAASSLRSGNGVIVGVIDTGIDVSHPVFMNSLSPFDTRILRIWDQGLDPNAAHGEVGPSTSLITSPHTYGVEFTNTMINNHLNNPGAGTFRHRDCVGHGTHVAAIAAGNGNPGGSFPLLGVTPGNFDFVGVAPKADIVVVKFLDVKEDIRDTAGNAVSGDVRLRDAVKYILEVAKTVNAPAVKPAVINCSFGSDLDAHDGLTASEQVLDQLFDSASGYYHGNILVFAAGNAGGKRQHAKITIPAAREIIIPFELYDTRGAQRREYKECAWQDDTKDLLVDMWYREVSPPEDVSVAVKVPTDTSFSSEVFSGFLTKTFDGNKRRTISHQAVPAVSRPVTAGPAVSVQRNRIILQVEPSHGVTPQHRTGIYEIRIKGPQGTVVQAWTFQRRHLGFRVGPSTTLSADEAAGSTSLHVADTGFFSATDQIKVLLNDGTEFEVTINAITPGAPGVLDIASGLPSPADHDKEVIKVLASDIEVDNKFLIGPEAGAKNVLSVAAYEDKNGNTADAHYANITVFSSRGPLADYSTGSGPYADKPDIAAPGRDITAALSVDKDGTILNLSQYFGNRFIELSGTSMAAPHITGVIALLLEKKPTLTVDEVKAIFSNSANVRSGTGPTPANVPDYQLAYGGGMVDAKRAHDAVVP